MHGRARPDGWADPAVGAHNVLCGWHPKKVVPMAFKVDLFYNGLAIYSIRLALLSVLVNVPSIRKENFFDETD